MRLIGSRETQALTGLSADQLREWTGRRGLIRPDRPAQGKGTQTRFSWQTVLVLRLALALRQEFHIELQAHRGSLAELQVQLQGRSFPKLWDHVIVLRGKARLTLIRLSEVTFGVEEAIVVAPLAPHLHALLVGFGMPAPMQQLPLFRAVGVR